MERSWTLHYSTIKKLSLVVQSKMIRNLQQEKTWPKFLIWIDILFFSKLKHFYLMRRIRQIGKNHSWIGFHYSFTQAHKMFTGLTFVVSNYSYVFFLFFTIINFVFLSIDVCLQEWLSCSIVSITVLLITSGASKKSFICYQKSSLHA